MLKNITNINLRIAEIQKELNMNTTDVAVLKTHIALLERGVDNLNIDQPMADQLLKDINNQIEVSNANMRKRYRLFKNMVVLNTTLSWGAIFYVLIH